MPQTPPCVLHLTPRYRPHLGGVERHLACLNGELLRRGWRVTVVTERYTPQLPAGEVDGHETVWRLSRRRFAGLPGTGLLRVWLGLVRLAAVRQRATIVHCHDWQAFLFWYLPFRLLAPSRAVYVTFHGWEGRDPPARAVVVARRLVQRLARGTLAIGTFIARWYGTVPDAVTLGAVSLPSELPEKREVAVFVGRLAADTGLMTYLEALRLVRDRHHLVLPLEVYGDGPLAGEARRFAEAHGLAVSWHAPVSDVPTVWGPARLAFASGYLAILEAMVHRAEVFAVYDGPLKRDYLTDVPAWLCHQAGSAETLAQQLAGALVGSPDSARRLAEAADWAAGYSAAALADTYERLWQTTSVRQP